MTDGMRKPAGWMQLPIDDRILEALDQGLILSPTIIAVNIDKSRSEVSRRLSVLTDKGFVDRVETGKYRITTDGERYLRGEVNANDF